MASIVAACVSKEICGAGKKYKLPHKTLRGVGDVKIEPVDPDRTQKAAPART